jgi:diguanylate cyclase (GGDEF)-like protein/PAS domain S-box-containing protein
LNTPIAAPPRAWLDPVAMAILIGVAAWLSLTLARGPGELAAVWIGNGLLTGWLLSRPTRAWPAYLVAGFVVDVAARQLASDQALHATALGAFNIIEVLIVAGVIRRLVPDVGDPKGWLRLGGIATASTLVACAVSGLLAASVTQAVHGTAFLTNFITWYAAHVVGMVTIGTTTLVVHREGLDLIAAHGRRWTFAGSMLLLVVVGVVIFQSRYPVLFLAYPPLLLAAFRHRFAGVAVGITLLSVIGGTATALGRGPVWLVEDIGMNGRIALLQIYIAGGCLMTIPVALAMSERKRLADRVRDSERRYRMLADYSHDVVVRMRANGERLYVSPSARDILGWEPAEMLGSRWELVHPDDRERQAQAMADVIASGEPRTEVYRVRHKDGHYVWVEVVTRPIPSVDEEGAMDIIYAGRDVSRRVAVEQALEASRLELEQLARVDTLTGLANRRQFDERFSLALMRLRRHGLPIALMYLDVDHFKHINDNFGHAAGDAVLRTFAQRLTDCTRASDLVARLGGDEFVVLIEDAALPGAAEVIARKLIDTMGAQITVEDSTLQVTTSIGIAYAAQPTEAATLTAAADAALYAAKKAGRNTYSLRGVDDQRRRGGETSARESG